MNTNNSQMELQELKYVVAHLSDSLASSERRFAHLYRIVRWGSLVFVLLLITAGFVASDSIGSAYAQKEEVLEEASTVVDALNGINQNLAMFGMLGQAISDPESEISKARSAIKMAIWKNPDVQAKIRAKVADILESKGEAVSEAAIDAHIQNNMEEIEMMAESLVINETVETLVDTVVLMHRIRDDSNKFRQLVGGPVPVLEGIQRELTMVNAALLSVPVMAAQMDIMNRNMASMTHSMGSTMGRMGNWMPW